MDTKLEIEKAEFDAAEKQYKAALLRRQKAIHQQVRMSMTQQGIADYWGVDISRINRLIKGKVKK